VEVVVVRHGETEWSRTGRHTGRSDIPLTENGRRHARNLAGRLEGRPILDLGSQQLFQVGGWPGHPGIAQLGGALQG